jgi:LacI family transcriptional regulator
MITIKQVAQHAGVSRATVSRVLNHQPQVDPVLRDRVLAAAAALNYQPSAVAQSLRRQETHTIGLIVPDNRNPFFAEIASGIEEHFYRINYSVYLCNSADDEAKEIDYCHNLYRQGMAGVIMAITGTTAERG